MRDRMLGRVVSGRLRQGPSNRFFGRTNLRLTDDELKRLVAEGQRARTRSSQADEDGHIPTEPVYNDAAEDVLLEAEERLKAETERYKTGQRTDLAGLIEQARKLHEDIGGLQVSDAAKTRFKAAITQARNIKNQYGSPEQSENHYKNRIKEWREAVSKASNKAPRQAGDILTRVTQEMMDEYEKIPDSLVNSFEKVQEDAVRVSNSKARKPVGDVDRSTAKKGETPGLYGNEQANSTGHMASIGADVRVRLKLKDPNREKFRLKRDEAGVAGLVHAVQSYFGTAATREVTQTIRDVYGRGPAEAIAGSGRPSQFKANVIDDIHFQLVKQIQVHERAYMDSGQENEKKSLHAKLQKLVNASVALEQLKQGVTREAHKAVSEDARELRNQAFEVSVRSKDENTDNELNALAQRKKNILKIASSFGLTEKDVGVEEVQARLNDAEEVAKERKQREREAKKKGEESAATKAKEEAARRERRGETGISSYKEYEAKRQEANKVLKSNSSSAQEREDAEAFLFNEGKIRERVASAEAFRSEIQSRHGLLGSYKKILKKENLGAEERKQVQQDIRRVEGEIHSMKQALETEEQDKWTASSGTRARVQRARLAGRKTVGLLDRVIQKPRDVVKEARKKEWVQGVGEEVSTSAKAWGLRRLWVAQAQRYRKQQDAAIEAQRTAKSGLWAWWYTFSKPVQRTVKWTMMFSPAMVPLGALQVATWMVFAVFAFVVNMTYAIIVEILNLVLYGFLSILNIAGSLLQGLADAGAQSFVGSIGICPNGINTAGCAYQSLEYTYGVNVIQATSLIPADLFFPTVFHNNSLISHALTFLGNVPGVLLLGVSLGLMLIPLLWMQEADPWARWLVAIIIGALTWPAVMLHQFLDINFYHQAAEVFRTGYSRVFEGPAVALAERARDLIVNAKFPSIAGGAISEA